MQQVVHTLMTPARTEALLAAMVAACFATAALGATPPNTGMADSAALIAAYDKFVAALPDAGRVQTIPLASLRGITSESFNAGGRVTIDAAAGIVSSTVRLLPQTGSFDLWLADNRAGSGHTTLAEPSDVLLKIGTYTLVAAGRTLSVTLSPATFNGFFPDRAFVVRTGQSPLQSFVLTGASTTLARLLRRQVRFAGQPADSPGFDPGAVSRSGDFAQLVADGRRVFLKEQFNGNGRACGTCHAETNNFTIDPKFIAGLPRTDPLFVAETNPDLADLERPSLMRQLGLILVNADGFEPQSRFTMRSTQNVQALGNSMAPQTFVVDFSTNGRNPNPSERLGWGNDGAPLRDFALVAIAQHATRSMRRAAGADFRVPTDEELDALVAYQLALGRQEDFKLASLELKSALAMQGKALFLDTGDLFGPARKNCNACHFNAGGTSGMSFDPRVPGFPDADGSPANFNIAAGTNVNETPLALALMLPRDGGFGALPTIFGSFGNTADVPPFGHLELEEFNSPPVVESADTGPFFHNHTVGTLEGSIAFYGTQAFKNTIFTTLGALPINISSDPNDPEVQAIAAFLRVLNVLENIRSAINVAERARQTDGDADARELTMLALAEAQDALEVLSEGALAVTKEGGIPAARSHVVAALAQLKAAEQLPSAAVIRTTLEQVTRSLRTARSELATLATLPSSFQN